MLRRYGRSSPVRDGVGIVLVVATALLYVFGVSQEGGAPGCASCDEAPAAPAATPLESPPDGSLRSASVKRYDAGVRKGGAVRG